MNTPQGIFGSGYDGSVLADGLDTGKKLSLLVAPWYIYEI